LTEFHQLAAGLLAGLADTLPFGGSRQFALMPWLRSIGPPPALPMAALMLGLALATATWLYRDLADAALGLAHLARGRRGSPARHSLAVLAAAWVAPILWQSVSTALPAAMATGPWGLPGLRQFAPALAALGLTFLVIDLAALRVRRVEHMAATEALVAGALATAGHWLGLGAMAPALVWLRLIGVEREAALRLAALAGLPSLAASAARLAGAGTAAGDAIGPLEAAAIAIALLVGLACLVALGRWLARHSFLPVAALIAISGVVLSFGAFLLPGLFR